MKRFLVVLVILAVIAGAIAAVPWWFGREAEKSVRAYVNDLERNGAVDLTEKRYRQGWLSSEAVTNGIVEPMQVKVEADHRIEHGPFPLSMLTSGLGNLRPVQALVDSRISATLPGEGLAGRLGPLRARTTIDLYGNGATRLELPASQLEGKDGTSARIGAAEGRVSFRPRESRLTGRVKWQGATIDAPRELPETDGDLQEMAGGRIVLDAVTTSFDLTQSPGEIQLGELELVLEGARALDAGGDPVGTLGDASLTFGVDRREGLIDSSTRVRLQSLETGGRSYGPGSLELALQGMDAQGVSALQRATDQGEVSPVLLLGLVVPGETALEVEASFGTPDGPVQGGGRIALTGKPDPQATGNPFAMLALLDARANLSVPKPVAVRLMAERVEQELEEMRGDASQLSASQRREVVARAVAERLDAWVRQGLLREQEDSYVCEATFSDGRLTVNGEPLQWMSLGQ